MIAFQASAPKSKTPSPHIETDPVVRMASVMRELAFAGQTVDAEALALRGFTSEEIEACACKARDLAIRQSIRRVA